MIATTYSSSLRFPTQAASAIATISRAIETSTIAPATPPWARSTSAVPEQQQARAGVEHHQREHRVLRSDRRARRAPDRDGAVVGECEAEHVPGYEHRDLRVPDRVRRVEERRLERRRAEKVPPAAEGVRGQGDAVLALVDQKREVVRDRVCQRDRDQARDEDAGKIVAATGDRAGGTHRD